MRPSYRFREQMFAFDSPDVRAFFRARHAGEKLHAAVAVAAGVSARCVEKWFAGETAPTLRPFCRMVAHYGPELMAIVLPTLGWVSDAALREQRARLKAEIARMERELEAME